MMKKLASLLLILITVALALPCSVFAESEEKVIDSASIFTKDEITDLEQKVESFIKNYNMDLVILTNKKSHSGDASFYAESYYQKKDLGIGSDRRGILLFYDLYSSDFVIYTNGLAKQYLSESRLDDFKSKFPNVLRKAKNGAKSYGNAFSYAIELVNGYCQSGIPKEVSSHYRGVQRRLTGTKIIVSAVIALATGLIISLTTVGSYKLKGNTYQYDYRKNGEARITHKLDQFVNTTHTHVRIPSSGSSSHGGPHHSGGGGHFGGGHSGGGGGRSMHI